MSSKGWIKLHRKIQDHWLYNEKRKFSKYEAWLDLLLMANHQDRDVLIDNEISEVKKGDLITSIRTLCERWEWSNTKVKNFLELLQKDSMISYKSDTKKTVITIVKYGVYHDSDSEKTYQKHHENDTETHQKHTNKNLRIKELEEEEEEEEATENPFKIYEENFGILKPILRESFIAWCDDLSDEVVIAGMKLAAQRGGQTFSYVEAILKEWAQAGVKTIEDARNHVRQRDKQKNNVRQFPVKKAAGDIDWENI